MEHPFFCIREHLYKPFTKASLAHKVFLYKRLQLVLFKAKLHFHVKTSITFFTVSMPLRYGKLF